MNSKMFKPSLISSVLCILLVAMQLGGVEARKSYHVKDQIRTGTIRVHQPRVRNTECEWCFFKDRNNDFCVTCDINWKLESKSSNVF